MASHPLDYSPFPTVNPNVGGTGARERIDARPDAFGAQIGQAVQTLGGAVEKAAMTGLELVRTQDEIDAVTHASELHSWQSEQTSRAQAEFLSLKGKAAVDAQPEFDKRVREIHDEAKGQAGNPYTTRLVDNQGRRLVDATTMSAARHAAAERKTWETRTYELGASTSGDRAVLIATQSPAVNLSDDIALREELETSDKYVAKIYDAQGYDENAVKAALQKNRGRNVKNIVEQIAAGGGGTPENPSQGDLTRASAFFKAQEDKIDAGSRTAITNYLRGPWSQIYGAQFADEAMGRPPAGSQKPEVVEDIPANFISAIKSTEGYRSKAYWDVKQHTVGFGTRASSPDEVITPEEANARFNREIGKAAKFVDSVNPNLDPGTRAALASLTFNAGETWATAGLGDAIRAGDLGKAKELFLQYNKAGGETNQGLVMRRAREASWFGRGEISASEAGTPRLNKGDVMLKILDDPNLQNRPQVQAAALARVNKIYQAWDLQQSQNKASFDVSVKNATAEALATGQVKNPLSREQFIMNYGAADGDAQWAEYQANVQLGADVHTTANLAPAELASLREKYTPQPGEHFIDQQKRLSILDKAIAANAQAREDDPASFLITRTEFGKEAYGQFQAQMSDKNASPEMRTAYADMYASKMRQEQARLGIAADKVRIVPQAYVDQLSARLNNPSLNGGSLAIVQGIEAEARLWGSHWPEVYRQMAKNVQPVVRVIGSGVKPDAAQVLADLSSVSLPDILKDQNAERSGQIKKDVLDAFKPLAGSMGGQEGAISVFNDFREQAEKLAAKYVVGGMTSSDAATKAFDDLVGFKYTFQEGYRVPKEPGIDPTQVMAGALAVKTLIGDGKGYQPAAARDTLGGLSPEYLARETARAYARDGKWVTSPDEKGLMLTYNDRAVRMGDGAPLIVPWRELQDLGRPAVEKDDRRFNRYFRGGRFG